MTLEADRKAGRVERAAGMDPLQTLRDALPTLSGARRGVAEVILADPGFAGGASITALADRAGTLPATITRLATFLGFSGYPALRAAVAEENGRGSQANWESDIGSEISPTDPPEHVLSVLTSRQFGAMRNAMGSIDLPLVEDLADRIAAASRVVMYAQWGDLPPAKELHMRLLRIGIPAWLHEGEYEAEVNAGLLDPSGVAILISRSGEGSFGEKFFAMARSREALTVVVTGEPSSTLAGSADVTMFTGTRVGSTWTDYFAGRTSDSLATALLFVLVAQRMPLVVRSGERHLLYNEPTARGSD